MFVCVVLGDPLLVFGNVTQIHGSFAPKLTYTNANKTCR